MTVDALGSVETAAPVCGSRVHLLHVARTSSEAHRDAADSSGGCSSAALPTSASSRGRMLSEDHADAGQQQNEGRTRGSTSNKFGHESSLASTSISRKVASFHVSPEVPTLQVQLETVSHWRLTTTCTSS